MAASVSTLVVSWKDAAEINESVESEAFVMPSSTALPCAGTPARFFHLLIFEAELELIHHFFRQKFRVADIFHTHPAHHLTRDDFQMLVVDIDALQAVHFLNFVDEILLQFLLAANIQNVVRIARTIHQRIAGHHALAFLHIDMHAARQRVFALFAVVAHNVDACADPWRFRRISPRR